MPPTAPRAIDIVVKCLAPYLGENMARAAVRGQTLKLGLDEDLDRNGLERLLAAIGPGLGVFVGRDKTQQVTDDIRQAVFGAGGKA